MSVGRWARIACDEALKRSTTRRHCESQNSAAGAVLPAESSREVCLLAEQGWQGWVAALSTFGSCAVHSRGILSEDCLYHSQMVKLAMLVTKAYLTTHSGGAIL